MHKKKGRSVQISFDYRKNVTVPISRDFLDRRFEYADPQTQPS
ncbi:MAG TPA: hypothetical protein PLA83_07080 [Deltaproteobacteria bacterium]|nr:hypothetical protein [Deltaproteobacteria bacterium]HQI01181.1 hypothetical protein [Deltaproteobacteria bacterium]HQJ08098.1 hypothetical protein [Deltaproteobacteria bacterium]